MELLSITSIVVLVLLHVFAGRLRFLNVIPRSRWLSFAGGAAVAYVFVHLMPELNRIQDEFAEPLSVLPTEQPVFVLALIGLVVFYMLERYLRRAMPGTAARGERAAGRETAGRIAFRVHMISFAIYNTIIGYFVSELGEQSFSQELMFVIAMAFHFVVNDYGLRADHGERYERYGRWILSASLLFGWLIGLSGWVTGVVPHVMLAVIAGGVIMNTLKEELPAERESRAWAFIAGAAGYAVLLHFI